MSTNIGSLIWVSGIDNTGLRRDASKASQLVGGVGKTADSVTGQLKRMAGALGLVAGGAGLVSLGRQVIEVRGQFQQLGIAFETMLNSKEKADKLMSDVVTFAQKTPFTLTDVATNVKQLMAMGIATENVMDTMKALGDVAAGVAVPISRVAINYGQVAVLGKLQGREVRDFAMAMIPLTQQLADNMGKSKAQISDMVTAGKIGFPEVEAAFKSMAGEGGQFYNLMEKQNASVTGQISNLTDKWEVMLNDVGKANEGLIYSGISGLGELINNYKEILEVLEVLVVTYGAYRVAVMLSNAAMASGAVIANVKAWFELASGIKTAKDAQIAFNLASSANPLGVVIALVAGLTAAYFALKKEAKTTKELIDELNMATEKIGRQIELDAAIKQFGELKDKVGKTKDEQDKFNGLVKKLVLLYPDAIGKTDKYGVAIDLVTDKLIKQNDVVKESLRLLETTSKKENEANLKSKQDELDKLATEQKSGKTQVFGKQNPFTGRIPLETVDISEKRRLENAAKIVKLREEITSLGGAIADADNSLLKLGTKAADEFIKKHAKLFKNVNDLTRDEAISSRQQLLELFEAANKNEQDAITQRADELDKYSKNIKTTREEINQWVNELAIAETKLKEFKRPSYESKAGTPGQDIADQEAAIKDLREKLGLKENKDAQKLADDRLDYETEIGRKRISAQLQIEQDLLNLKEDSDDKLRKQAELNYRKTLNEIATQKAEQIKKRTDLSLSSTLPDADQNIIKEQIAVAEKVKADAIEKINKDSAEKISALWEKVTNDRLSGIEQEKQAVKDKYASELKEAIKLKNTKLVGAINENIAKETSDITRRYKLQELDFLQEIEYKKNEVTASGFDKEYKLQKLNYETFKRFQEQKIAVLRTSTDPEAAKQAKLLQSALDAAGSQHEVEKSRDLANNFYDAADYASDLANAIGDGNSGLSEMLKGISRIANTIGDLASSGAFNRKMSKSSGISSAISGATTLIGIVVGQAARNKKEMEDYYRSIIRQQYEYNIALNEQLLLGDEIGKKFYTDYEGRLARGSEALLDANKNLTDGMEKFLSLEAIVGKKKAVSGGNILGGIGAGAALGAGIGAVAGVGVLSWLTAPIGAAIGAVVGGIVGLFARKKKDIVAPLLETYPDLIKANGQFNASLAETLIANNKVKDSTKEVLQEMIGWQKAVEAARTQMVGVIEDIVGNVGSDLRDALVKAFEDGSDAAMAMGVVLNEVVEDYVSNLVFAATVGPLLDKLKTDMFASQGLDENGNVPDRPISSSVADGNFVDDFGKLFSALPAMVDSFNKTLSAAQSSAGQYGFDLFTGSTSSSSKLTSTSQIQRALTEDTGSAIMGLWRRSLDEQKTQTGVLLKSNVFLFEISANTLRTANNTDKLESAIVELKGIYENTRKSYLNDMGL